MKASMGNTSTQNEVNTSNEGLKAKDIQDGCRNETVTNPQDAQKVKITGLDKKNYIHMQDTESDSSDSEEPLITPIEETAYETDC